MVNEQMLKLELHESNRFSVLGETFEMRLNEWDKVPTGKMLFDAVFEDSPIRLFCEMREGALSFSGKWQAA